MKQQHKHAELLRALADNENIEVKDETGNWVPVYEMGLFSCFCKGQIDELKWRIKPKSTSINGPEIHYGEAK